MAEPIAQFDKNSNEQVRVTLEEYRGKQLFDVRVYYHDGTEWKPSKKGVALRVELFPEFREAVERLEKVIEERGLTG